MHKATGHFAILAGAGIGAYALATAMDPERRAGLSSSAEAPVVVTLPQRTADPSRPQPPPQPSVSHPPPDRASLVRQLQGELKRVGCYEGDLNGSWTPATRRAMQAFTERVNAKLPVNKPDHILLALVQGHRDRVCGATCPAGQALQADGACAGPALAPGSAPGSGGVETSGLQNPASTNAPPIVPVPPRLVSPPREVERPAAAPKTEAPAPAVRTEPPKTIIPPQPVPRMSRHGGPVPPAGIYERRSERAARRNTRQMRYARRLLRNLQRAGILPWRLP
jgi:hypothetical protein